MTLSMARQLTPGDVIYEYSENGCHQMRTVTEEPGHGFYHDGLVLLEHLTKNFKDVLGYTWYPCSMFYKTLDECWLWYENYWSGWTGYYYH